MTNEELFWSLAEELMKSDKRLVRGTIMKGACLRVGKEFLALPDFQGSGMIVKLPKERVQLLIAQGKGRPFGPGAKVFKEWVAIPKPDRRNWRKLLLEGIAFVAPG